MTRIDLCALFFLLLFQIAFTQGYLNPQAPAVQFAKGNIAEKTAAVKCAGENSSLAKTALDFVIDNAEILKNDRDFAGLAVAAVLSFPVDEYKNSPTEVVERFSKVILALDDANVKISVFEKLAAFYNEQEHGGSVKLVNEYLANAAASNIALDDTVKKAVEVLGIIGYGSSFSVLYSILRMVKWQEIHPNIEDALVSIADKSLNEIVDTVSKSELVELKLLFKIYAKNDKISSTLQCEIAEKILNRSMIIARNFSLSNDLADFQLENAKILAENRWTRSAELGQDYFNLARKAYENKFLSEERFAVAIDCVEKISSHEAVKYLSEYMQKMNKAQESGGFPSKAVVLATINALGSLGDKSAFDCLLYVTYLNYSEDVTAAARNALTRLKW